MTERSGMTVQDLFSASSLGLRLLAGETGLQQSVLWAHSCEMINPSEWLGPHELLLTVGLCVPSAAAEQAAFISALADSHLAGLVLGDHETCPPVSDAMLQEADRRGFPVLVADARTPWAAIARHVAAANASSQIIQVLSLSKLYQVATNADDDYEALLQQLSQLLGVGLAIVDKETGVVVLETQHANADRGEQSLRIYQLPSAHAAELHLFEFPGEALDSFMLVHLLKVLALNADRLLGSLVHRASESAHALQQLEAGKPCPEAQDLLAAHSDSGLFFVAAVSSESGDEIARRAALLQLPLLFGPGATHHHAFIPEHAVSSFRELTDSVGVHVGLSSAFSNLRDVRAAIEESNRVLSAARYGKRLWVEFEGTTVALLTRSQREADEIINGVLGALAGDSESSSKLRDTLFAYLRNDRHWQQTADELGIHRQTLSYRLGRIEEETGMNVQRSADLSAFWIAYQAWLSSRAQ